MTQEASTAPEYGYGAETPSTAARHWLEEALPEDALYESGGEAMPLRDHPALQKYGSAQDMAKALLHAQDLIGRKTVGLTPLAEDATDEDRQRFDGELRRVLGVPDDPGGYDIRMPEGLGADERLQGWFRKAAHESGLSPAQAQNLSDRYNDLLTDAAREFGQYREQRREETRRVLAGLWGSKAGANTEIAKRGFERLAGRIGLDTEEASRILEEHGDDQTMIRLFHEIGKAHQEDGYIAGNGGPRGRGEAMSPEQFFAEVVFGGKGD